MLITSLSAYIKLLVYKSVFWYFYPLQKIEQSNNDVDREKESGKSQAKQERQRVEKNESRTWSSSVDSRNNSVQVKFFKV